MKKSLPAAALCSALALTLSLTTASAQEQESSSEVEGTNRWFVELTDAPTADGNSLANVRAGKAAFKKAAANAGVKYKELRSFDTLFNGYSVQIDASNRAKLARVDGVKNLWPVEKIEAPEIKPGSGGAPDLASAITLTGANIAQGTLGLTGAGIKVAVMDTGIDYDNADLGGDGTQRSNSNVFPTLRVVEGWDFVGDAYDAANPASPAPVSDPYPDDCNGHGSHVAGIVGASGTLTGVAPGVEFGAYRVFGCTGSTDSDIMIAAMERALADGMDVLNMSIGASFQWPQYPTAAAATRLVNQGMVVVASIGNAGPQGSAPNGLYSASAPGAGEKAIGVASFDNTQLSQRVFTLSPDDRAIPFGTATAAPPPPTSGSLDVVRTLSLDPAPNPQTTPPTPAGVEGCPLNADYPTQTPPANPWQGGLTFPPGSLAGKALLVRRGTCGFHAKAFNAQQAGAAAVILYNNVAGTINPTVAGTPAITIPVVAITLADGQLIDGRIAGGGTVLTWGSQTIVTPVATGGLISGFSSFGLAPDLSIKPDIGAPGGFIFSTIPIELGTFGNNSGTSMAAPHVAGAAALVLEARPDTSSNAMRSLLQNSADPKPWFGNPNLGFIDNVHRQGAGMVDIDDAILSTVSVEPGKLSLGESEAVPHVRTLTIRNTGASAVTFDLTHTPALATGPQNNSQNAPPNNVFTVITYLNAPATVAFDAPSVVVPAGGSATVNATITPNAALGDRSSYGGYIVLTPQGGGQAYRVPYAGLKGDYQTVQVLVPTPSNFPWLASTTNGATFTNRPTGHTFTMVGLNIPFFAVHLDHQARRVKFEAVGVNGKAWHTISDDEYVARNSTATGFFAFAWDGTTSAGTKTYTVPNGQYVAKLSVLKALGDPANPAHWETWTSPVITIARP